MKNNNFWQEFFSYLKARFDYYDHHPIQARIDRVTWFIFWLIIGTGIAIFITRQDVKFLLDHL